MGDGSTAGAITPSSRSTDSHRFSADRSPGWMTASQPYAEDAVRPSAHRDRPARRERVGSPPITLKHARHGERGHLPRNVPLAFDKLTVRPASETPEQPASAQYSSHSVFPFSAVESGGTERTVRANHIQVTAISGKRTSRFGIVQRPAYLRIPSQACQFSLLGRPSPQTAKHETGWAWVPLFQPQTDVVNCVVAGPCQG